MSNQTNSNFTADAEREELERLTREYCRLVPGDRLLVLRAATLLHLLSVRRRSSARSPLQTPSGDCGKKQESGATAAAADIASVIREGKDSPAFSLSDDPVIKEAILGILRTSVPTPKEAEMLPSVFISPSAVRTV